MVWQCLKSNQFETVEPVPMPMFLSLLLLSKKDANIGRRIEAVAKVDVGGGALEQLETYQLTAILSWIGRRKGSVSHCRDQSTA